MPVVTYSFHPICHASCICGLYTYCSIYDVGYSGLLSTFHPISDLGYRNIILHTIWV